MPFWRCSTGILRRPSSAYVSGGGQTQSHSGTIVARSTRRFGTTFPTSVMVIALRSAAIGLFDDVLFSLPGSRVGLLILYFIRQPADLSARPEQNHPLGDTAERIDQAKVEPAGSIHSLHKNSIRFGSS